MAALLIAEAQYVELWSELILQLEALRSLPGGVADIATMRKCRTDLRQVQPAHKLAFDNLVSLLDDQEEITTVHAEFCAIDDSADELSSVVLES